MNHYEVLAIVSGALADTEVPSAITKLEETLKKYECTIHYNQNLERRRLAYPVKHQQYGSYILIEFDCSPTMLSKLENDLRLTSEVLRHVIVKRDTVGKPRPLFKEVESSFSAEKRPARKEAKTVTLDEALQTVERETKEAKEQAAPDQTPAEQPKEDASEKTKKPETPASGTAKHALSDEDLEKQLDERLEEILKGEV